ncbi:hypothetical protein [Segniliparus rugosus]|nr:hypothetical protein [Segniliparus rugosus]
MPLPPCLDDGLPDGLICRVPVEPTTVVKNLCPSPVAPHRELLSCSDEPAAQSDCSMDFTAGHLVCAGDPPVTEVQPSGFTATLLAPPPAPLFQHAAQAGLDPVTSWLAVLLVAGAVTSAAARGLRSARRGARQ